MIVSESTPISLVDGLGQGSEPQAGYKSRVSAIVFQAGAPVDGVLVELLDSTKKVLLGREKTDYQGRVSFDSDTSYLPVILRVVPPSGLVVSPVEKRTITWPVAGGVFDIVSYFEKNWSWDRSERFTIGAPSGIPDEVPQKKDAPTIPDDIFTFKNIVTVAGVAVGLLVVYNIFRGGISSDD